MHRALALTLLLISACDGALDARSAWIVSQLVDGDRDLVATRRARVVEKYAVMADSLQGFLRGSALLFFRDHSALTGTVAVRHGSGAELVQLYGDAHLENLGANYEDTTMFADVVDFDATHAGPFAWDVGRAALGLSVGLIETPLSRAQVDDAVAALAQGYADAVADTRSDGAVGDVLQDLFDDAEARRLAHEELIRYTRVDDVGTRHLLRDAELVELTAWSRDQLTELLQRYRATRRGGAGLDEEFRILDAAARLSMGVASLANERYWILIAGDRDDQNRILELKEERDPPLPSDRIGRGPVGDQARRVVDGTNRLLSCVRCELDLGVAHLGALSFQVRRVARGRRALDVNDLADDLRKGRYDGADIAALGHDIGALIARGHLRSVARRDLSTAIGDATGFVAAIVRDAERDLASLRTDYALFQAALARRGPDLGAP